MSKHTAHNLRRLAVAPSTRGFGFAVLEGDKLVDWGVKSVSQNKNSCTLAKVAELLSLYHPALMVLEEAESTRRSTRIRKLHTKLVSLAKRHKIKVKLLTRAKVRGVFFADGEGTKDALAALLAERFPEELKSRLPPKRRPWMSEDYRMGIFDAVALGLAPWLATIRTKSQEI